MKAREILDLRVVDATSGTTMGSVTGILIDGEKKQVVAIEIGGGFLSHPGYLPFASIKSIKNDELTIQSPDALVEQAEFESPRLVGSLVGHKVYTEDGKNLGSVEDYDIDIKAGGIASVTIAIDTSLLGRLWRSTEKRFVIPRDMIITLGDSVVVDSSVPTMIWTDRAA